MILSGTKIIEEYSLGNLKIDPFDYNSVNPDSYDLSLNDLVYTYEVDVIDSRNPAPAIQVPIPDEGIILKKGKYYYAYAKESVSSDMFVPILHNKSGVARKGLFTHITADLQQIHSDGRILLQLYPINDIRVFRNQKIVQVSFWCILV
jgi:dCTP deaminase